MPTFYFLTLVTEFGRHRIGIPFVQKSFYSRGIWT